MCIAVRPRITHNIGCAFKCNTVHLANKRTNVKNFFVVTRKNFIARHACDRPMTRDAHDDASPMRMRIAIHRLQSIDADMRVDLRAGKAFVAHHLLNDTQISPAIQHVRGKGMAQRVR